MRITESLRKAWPIAMSVGLYSLAFPPANLGLLVFVALVPWFLSLQRCNGKEAFRSGLLFGALFWTYQMFWLVPFVGRWTHSVVTGAIPWLLCPPIGMWYFGLLGWLVHRSFATKRAWLAPIAWAGIEVLRAYFPLLAFPWGFLATPLWVLPPLIQGASFGQIFLVSSWVCAANLILTALFAGKAKQPFIAKRQLVQLGIVALAFLFLSLGRYQQLTTGTSKRIVVGQTGVDLAFGDKRMEQMLLASSTASIFDQAKQFNADLLILPEGLTRGGDGLPPSTPFGGDPPIPTIFGGQRGSSPTYQTAYAFDGHWQYADKTRLVIFGEYVPYRDYLPFLQSFDLPGGDLKPGDEIKTLEVNGIRVAPIVCFEELFPNIPQTQTTQGAQLLAVISVDDWFMGTMAPEQLASGCVWRAVENGLPMFRAASTGLSFACDARGNVIGRLPIGGAGVLRFDTKIPAASDAFPYRWVYPLIGLASILMLIIDAVFSRFRRPTASSR